MARFFWRELTIQIKKIYILNQVLCKSYPPEFISYFHYCRSLRFDDKPDYSYLKRLFRDLFIREGTFFEPYSLPIIEHIQSQNLMNWLCFFIQVINLTMYLIGLYSNTLKSAPTQECEYDSLFVFLNCVLCSRPLQ